jgi:hypothetical protein
MCPVCIGTAAWLASGGTSAASGLAAWVLKRRKRRVGSQSAPGDTHHYKQLQSRMVRPDRFCDHA